MVGGASLAEGFGFGDAKAAVGEMPVDWPALKVKPRRRMQYNCRDT